MLTLNSEHFWQNFSIPRSHQLIISNMPCSELEMSQQRFSFKRWIGGLFVLKTPGTLTRHSMDVLPCRGEAEQERGGESAAKGGRINNFERHFRFILSSRRSETVFQGTLAPPHSLHSVARYSMAVAKWRLDAMLHLALFCLHPNLIDHQALLLLSNAEWVQDFITNTWLT